MDREKVLCDCVGISEKPQESERKREKTVTEMKSIAHIRKQEEDWGRKQKAGFTLMMAM